MTRITDERLREIVEHEGHVTLTRPERHALAREVLELRAKLGEKLGLFLGTPTPQEAGALATRLCETACPARAGFRPCHDSGCPANRMADAFLAWLAEPEQIETMTRAITDLNGGVVHPHEAEADIRAAIAALRTRPRDTLARRLPAEVAGAVYALKDAVGRYGIKSMEAEIAESNLDLAITTALAAS